MTLRYDSKLYSDHTAVFNRVSKVISRLLWFCIAMLYDWLKCPLPLFQSIQCKTKTNHDLLTKFSHVTCMKGGCSQFVNMFVHAFLTLSDH